jgi:hypothetical protein
VSGGTAWEGGCSVACEGGSVGAAGEAAGAGGETGAGVSDDGSVCATARPGIALQNRSAELLRSSKRLLRLHIPDPHPLASENAACLVRYRPRWRGDAKSSRSSDGRRAGREECRWCSRKPELDGCVRTELRERNRQRHGGRLAQYQRADNMGEGADRAIMVSVIGWTVTSRWWCSRRCSDD